jgi:nucleoside-diphosphate-sugar epimerase
MERSLDRVENRPGAPRVIRLRPTLIFWARGADRVRRLFAGPLVATSVLRPSIVRRLPTLRGVRMQCVHARDVADAYRRALLADVDGAFNITAEPPLGPAELGEAFGAPPLQVPPRLVREVVRATHRLRLQPSPEGWIDMGVGVPRLSAARARAELGWDPTVDAYGTLRELLDGLRRHAGAELPPLDREAESGPLRAREAAALATQPAEPPAPGR